MSSPSTEVAVVIPTLAAEARGDVLDRAVASVVNQSGVTARPLVVVNGPWWDQAILARLAADPRVSVVRLEDADLPKAISEGVSRVTAPYFTVLDDDDLLLPGALAHRVGALERHPEALVVVTNGWRRSADGDRIHILDPGLIIQDPLRALLEINWMPQGSWLCRTGAIGVAEFAHVPKHLECTYLAAQFASTGRLIYDPEPTFVWTIDTPGSASKSEAYRLGEVHGLRMIMRLPVPGWFRRGVERKIAEAYHTLSDEALKAGQSRRAWTWHLRSLLSRSGLRYLLFTRHLIKGTLRR